MKKHQYKINDSVYAFDNDDWVIPGTITAIDGELYRVEYHQGGYDWLIYDEIHPLEYHKGDYVKTINGIGIIKAIDSAQDIFTVSYGKKCAPEQYYEFELSPSKRPPLLTRVFKKGVYKYA